MKLSNIKTVFLLGIGGIGMSGLARYFNLMGCIVFGYDKTSTELTKKLESEGITIHYEDNIALIPNQADLIIFTPAIPDTHKQKIWLLEQGYKLYKRAEVLGMLSQENQVLAVAGTHGKTTTTSILAHLLKFSGIDCTAFIGGISKSLNSNFSYGTSEWMVVEADEYDRSFLHLHPSHSVITSVDADHLDIYGKAEDLLNTYIQFGTQTANNGKLFIHNNLPIIEELNAQRGISCIKYGINAGDAKIKNIRVVDGKFLFDLDYQGESHVDFISTMPGRHNIENSVAAILLALETGIPILKLKQALASFKGIKRRFEVHAEFPKIYIDDYAHHPGELKAAINAVREFYPEKKILGIFQPHLFSRTKDFAEEFGGTLNTLDECWLMEIYPARELPIPGITSKTIGQFIKDIPLKYLQKQDILGQILTTDKDVVMTLGAGDIDTLVPEIISKLQNLNP